MDRKGNTSFLFSMEAVGLNNLYFTQHLDQDLHVLEESHDHFLFALQIKLFRVQNLFINNTRTNKVCLFKGHSGGKNLRFIGDFFIKY